MPRVEFVNTHELQDWLSTWVTGVRSGKYHCFYTTYSELILVPTTSTDPIVYGYLRYIDKKEALNICKAFKLPLTECMAWIWSADRMPGVEK